MDKGASSSQLDGEDDKFWSYEHINVKATELNDIIYGDENKEETIQK